MVDALGVSPALVSSVVAQRRRTRSVQRALWMLMVEPGTTTRTRRVMPLARVFGPPAPVKMRDERKKVA